MLSVLVTTLGLMALGAVLNRLRGSSKDWKPSWLPGHARFYIAPCFGLAALVVSPWPVALAWAVGYLLWALPSWGHTLAAAGDFKPDREPGFVDRVLGYLPGDFLPIAARMLFVLPAVAAVAWLVGNPWFLLYAPWFAFGAAFLYVKLFEEMGWQDWARGEYATGAMWGYLIFAAGVLV